jgi:hypothetical protein
MVYYYSCQLYSRGYEESLPYVHSSLPRRPASPYIHAGRLEQINVIKIEIEGQNGLSPGGHIGIIVEKDAPPETWLDIPFHERLLSRIW